MNPDSKIIYLDNAATTPVLDEVLEEMTPFMKESYGNPSSLHMMGRRANNALDLARKRVMKLINSGSVIFTSGATEANNLAIKGMAHAMRASGDHIITSSIEHESVLEPCRALEREGFSVTYLPVDREGTVDLEALERSIDGKTLLVSIMFANNEVGTIQPIREITRITRRLNVFFHTDAVQAAGKVPIDVKELGIDLITLSAHKMHGPKGIGALCTGGDLKPEIEPILHGGGHERGVRSGTQNVAGVVGMGRAAEIALTRMREHSAYLKELRDRLIGKVLKEVPHSRLNGHPGRRLPNNAHFTFLGVNGEDLIMKLDEHGIAASTGSACSVHKQKASHVLEAMNFTHEEITGSLRLTLGMQNTPDEIDKTVFILRETVNELRKVSPFGMKYAMQK